MPPYKVRKIDHRTPVIISDRQFRTKGINFNRKLKKETIARINDLLDNLQNICKKLTPEWLLIRNRHQNVFNRNRDIIKNNGLILKINSLGKITNFNDFENVLDKKVENTVYLLISLVEVHKKLQVWATNGKKKLSEIANFLDDYNNEKLQKTVKEFNEQSKELIEVFDSLEFLIEKISKIKDKQ